MRSLLWCALVCALSAAPAAAAQPAPAATSLCAGARSTPGAEEVLPWAHHALHIALYFLALAAADAAASRALPSSARWFALHAAANAVVVAFSAADVARAAAAPLCAMLEAHESWVPSHIGFALHAYHFYAFTALRAEDVVHHLLFVLPTSLLNFSFAWGRVVNVFLFWVTGLPGGITYALLVLVKTGRLSPLREKAVSAALNTWLRTPGLVTFATVMCAAALHGLTRVPKPLAFLVAALAASNGLFYGKQAVESFVKRREGAAVIADAPHKGDGAGNTPVADHE